MRIELDLSDKELVALNRLRDDVTRDAGESVDIETVLRAILRAACVKARIVAGPPISEKKKHLRELREARMIPGPDDTADEGVERW